MSMNTHRPRSHGRDRPAYMRRIGAAQVTLGRACPPVDRSLYSLIPSSHLFSFRWLDGSAAGSRMGREHIAI